jgi:hypothetical protein
MSQFSFPKICFSVLGSLCGLVVRVPAYRSSGPEFDSQLYRIFREVVGLEQGPLSHCTDHATPSIRKSWH